MAAKDKDALPSVETIKHDIAQHLDLAVRIKAGRGNNAKEYDFHRGLLKFYSGYFRTAIQNIDKGRFAEAKKGVIELPYEEPFVFDIFKNWLYAPNRILTTSAQMDHTAFSYEELGMLWCFAERRIIPMLQNRAIDLIISKLVSRIGVNLAAVQYAYLNSSPGSHLRRVLVAGNILTCNIDASKMDLEHEGKEHWFQEWSIELNIERVKQCGKAVELARVRNRCSYHQHESGVECADKAWGVY